jgi:Domain of unknown function (DUF4157)
MRTFVQKAKTPQQTTASQSRETELAHIGQSHGVHSILHLQHTLGNHAVNRLLQTEPADRDARSWTHDMPRFGYDFSQIPGYPKSPARLQAKLTISSPGDLYEQEADRVSEQVMRMPEPQLQRTCPCGGGCSQCQTEQPSQEHERLQTKRLQTSDPGQLSAPPIVQEVLAAPGQPLDPGTRGFMEPRFGHDLSGVRGHPDAGADAASAAVGARAFTIGTDIVFRRGEFAPYTQPGRALLAHELAHVMQRQTGRPQLFRQAVIKPHYPTEEEQRKIEELLSRHYKTTRVVTSATGETVIQKGRVLTGPQISELADRLEGPFLAALDALDGGGAESADVLDATAALEVVKSAREAILDRFGKYTTRTAILTLDDKTTAEARKKAGQVLIIFGDPDAAEALARTIVEARCDRCKSALSDLDDNSKEAVIKAVQAKAVQQHLDQLRRVAKKRVPGKHSESARITLRLTGRTATMLFQTAVHELIHQLAHPAFHAAFLDERNIIEGFTDYFAHEIYGGNVDPGYAAMVSKVEGVRKAMRGPFHFVGDQSAEESLRQAYFGGHLQYIGWVPSSSEEQKAVAKARGPAEEAREPAQWDAGIARARAAAYRAQAQAQQGASRNVLQVGLFFAQKSSSTIAVRYARVIARTEPYAKGQLFLEGGLVGSPSLSPGVLGASLGIGAEYQEPYFYAAGGVRFVGTTLPGIGTNRLDVSPFVGIGVRAWQTVRVGAEGFVLLPLTGQDIQIGGGISLGVEFK